MKTQKRFLPPSKLKDLDNQSASCFLSLLRDLRHPTSLILGAGVSASAGVPVWSILLQKICASYIEHWEFGVLHNQWGIDSPPSDMSIVFTDDDYFSENAVILSKKLVKTDALLIAQQIKNCIREADWRYLLRKILYKDVKDNNSKLLENLAGLCAESEFIKAVINDSTAKTCTLPIQAQH